MFSFSSIWKFHGGDVTQYCEPFWDKNIYTFEFMSDHVGAVSPLFSSPLKISDICVTPPSVDTEDTPSLISEESDKRDAAITNLKHLAEHAHRVKTQNIIIWPGKIPFLKSSFIAEKSHEEKIALRKEMSTAFIDRLCRSLHSVAQEFPNIKFCIPTAQNIDELPFPDELEWIISDLHKYMISYWHNTSSAHLLSKQGIGNQELWLNTFVNKMEGIHLEDAVENEGVFPPGMGEIDFSHLREYISGKIFKVLRINSLFEIPSVWSAIDHLRDCRIL